MKNLTDTLSGTAIAGGAPAPAAPPAAATPAAPAQAKSAVLYVDDEEQALKYFRKAMAKEFEVHTAPGVAQALEILEAKGNQIGVVISDQRMPGRSGVELLTDVRKRWPNIVRILLTAYADIDSAVAAVNSGAIYKYLNKPADLEVMRRTLTDAMSLFHAQSEKEVMLRERMSELQRVIVADRVRSLTAMADGISHHLRNSMTAMSCFLEESEAGRAAAAGAGGGAPAAPDKGYMDELWRLAQAERESLLQVLQRVGRAARAPEIHPGAEFELGAIVARAVASLDAELGAGRVTSEVPATLPKCCGDAELISQLVTSIIRYAARSGQAGGKVWLGLEQGVPFWGTTAVRLRIRAEGGNWSDRDVAALFTPFAFPARDPSELGLEMLLAFYIVFQHGGDIAVRPGAPDGPGFEVLLPTDPTQVRRPRVTEAALTEMRA